MKTWPFHRVAAFALAAMGAFSCHPQETAFYDKIHDCDVSAIGDQCGTTRAGKPMVCFNGGQLGGEDFCAEKCDPATPSNDPSTVCLASGALLKTCGPRDGETDSKRQCPEGLACYRTRLDRDDGVCLKMHTCAEDSDCTGTERPACAATIARSLSPLFLADHLQCVRPGCKKGQSNCSQNEYCLGNYYQGETTTVDMCVPNCDPDGHCPPAFACAWAPGFRGAPHICLPGLPGVRCQSSQDCVLGDCVDTGAGFSQCVLGTGACTSEQSCSLLSSLSTFVCVEGVPGAGRHCVSTRSFDGADCMDNSECDEGMECYRYSPYLVDQLKGECRIPCHVDQKCPVRGGIPHVCLADGAGGCYPGIFGLPCTDSSQCAGQLACLEAPPDVRSKITSPKICTRTCASDDECRKDPLTSGAGICEDGLCRLGGAPGEPCETDRHCFGGKLCLFDPNDGGAVGHCAQ